MKKTVLEFIRRGLTAMGIGPLVLAALYGIMHHQGLLEALTVRQVCRGILSLSALAFIAGGMNVVYQIERLPLMAAVFLHGLVLYVSYLATYLVNGWLSWGTTPILVFSGIFVLGYLAIWAVICCIMKKRTEKINEIIRKNQENP